MAQLAGVGDSSGADWAGSGMIHMAGRDLRVGTIGGKNLSGFFGYEVSDFDPYRYMERGRRGSFVDFLREGRQGYRRTNWLYSAQGVDRLYRQRDPEYMGMVSAFIDQFHDADILILSSFNPIHPEILVREFPHAIKILGFIDDPASSYVRGIPYLWAFDGAVYISPSYDETSLMKNKLAEWGCEESHWWPLVPFGTEPVEVDDTFFSDRDMDLCYVGGAYGDKIDRLVSLKKHFGRRFGVYGRWPLKGLFGAVRCLYGKPALFMKVPSLTDAEREAVYHRTKIGINMHLSTVPRETGNMRMYEIPAHGMMQVCDIAGCSSHELIFKGNSEAVYYQSVEEAIDKIEHFLSHEEARISIAKAGYERVRKDYRWGACYKALLDWASSLAPRTHPQLS